MKIGEKLPSLSLPINGGGTVNTSDLIGRKLVLFFYPKDDTSGCTKEAIGFTDALDAFEAANTTVIGVSKDSVKSHDKFVEKHDLGVALIADTDGDLCEAFDVWREKQMYGKTFMGIERSTFLFDADGILIEEWRKVRVPGHVDAVLDAAQNA